MKVTFGRERFDGHSGLMVVAVRVDGKPVGDLNAMRTTASVQHGDHEYWCDGALSKYLLNAMPGAMNLRDAKRLVKAAVEGREPD